MDSGPKDRQQYLMFVSQIPINPPIGTQTHPKSSFATKRRKKTNMETFVLPEDALSPH
jgi:hypothetical protein